MENNFLFDETKHAYTLDGTPLIGTTTVLGLLAKPALIQWSANEAVKYVIENGEKHTLTRPAPTYTEGDKEEEIEGVWASLETLDEAKTAHRRKKEGAGDIGSQVHKWIEEYIAGNMPPSPEDPQMAKMINAFLEWDMKVKPRWIASEMRVYATSTWTAGTLDFIAEIDGKVFIGDFKTSTGIYDEAFWQMSAYQYMLQEMQPDYKIDGHIVVNIRKDGKLETKESYAYDTNIKGFLGLLMAYKVKNNLKTT